MSLKKIWNSLCGRSEKTETGASPENASAQPAVSAPSSAATVAPAAKARAPRKAAQQKLRKTPAEVPVSRTEPVAAAKAAAPAAPPKRGVLSMLSRGEHDALLKLINKQRPSSILEIGVGDGSRMPAILAMMDQSGVTQDSLKAIVIDEFELGGGVVAMRDYHRQLAGLSIRPVIFPEPVGRGLVSVAHRFGAVDLVLVDTAVEETNSQDLATFLGKVTHPGSQVLSNASGKWTNRKAGSDVARRAA
ncbi:hypothetical protein [Rhodopirellula sallentina]|uniref:Uncharacterized protein n=1 Tax=Rhodopirellula sallentina SM41 TaxID=1263870 RepID=M5TYB1_9BACT|nr:hypothetical protein [Rhodopirellula sallentina]EMI54029.1 hypothetical protein RSSM_04530 [Rhodopirellula sallentina SM41]